MASTVTIVTTEQHTNQGGHITDADFTITVNIATSTGTHLYEAACSEVTAVGCRSKDNRPAIRQAGHQAVVIDGDDIGIHARPGHLLIGGILWSNGRAKLISVTYRHLQLVLV